MMLLSFRFVLAPTTITTLLLMQCFSLTAGSTQRQRQQKYHNTILQDIQNSLQQSSNNNNNNENIIDAKSSMCLHGDISNAIAEFSNGKDDTNVDTRAWYFLKGIASSPTFVQEYWHKAPLLIRARHTGGWIPNTFTVQKDLRLVDNSYITGYKTAEILRNGTKTDTWALAPLKADATQKTKWSNVEEALAGGTIYFNTAGSLWPTLGALCKLTQYAFGLPSNVNVYVTPPGMTVSVPPHTDRQDVFVFQTQGAKRWRVFAPPPRSYGKDPLNRGKSGDVLSFDEMGPPLIDTVLKEGDFLYVPTGFPHTTDTTTTTVDDDDNNKTENKDNADSNKSMENVFHDTSVHLTMGLDTHVWCLTIAHLRWSLLQRCNKNFNLNIQNDEAYWTAMDTIPIGFLSPTTWSETISKLSTSGTLDEKFKQQVIDKLQQSLIQLEPNRWKQQQEETENDNDDNDENNREELPGFSEMEKVIEYMIQSHWASLMQVQEELFSNVNPLEEETLVRAFHGTQKQNLIMEKFGEFSNNVAFAQSFAQRRLSNEERTKGL